MNMNPAKLRAYGLTTALTMALLLIWATSVQAQSNEPSSTPPEACNAIGECVTQEEYAAIFSVDGLVNSGTFTDPVDNGDGTVTLTNIYTGSVTVLADPLERPVTATPELEPDAPTVREVLFPFRPRNQR